ncbi:MAG: hypothetical protein ACYT04_99945, partial [Nostoc sp.]
GFPLRTHGEGLRVRFNLMFNYAYILNSRNPDSQVGAIPCGQLKLHELPLQRVVLRKSDNAYLIGGYSFV